MKNASPSHFTLRSVILGVLLGLFVSGFTYFNDHVVQSNFWIGNFLPVGIFGVVLLIIMVVNPLLAGLRQGLALRGGEIAVATALGLAACAWPGSNLYRLSTGILAMPSHLIHFNSSWQSNHLMSYVPGLSDELAQGQVKDWNRFAEGMADADADADANLARLRRRMTASERSVFDRAAGAATVSVNEILQMTQAVNRLLALSDLQEESLPDDLPETGVIRANRAWLAASFPEWVLPSPRGKAVLVDSRGREDDVLRPLLEGSPRDAQLSLREIPWDVWGPPARLWSLVILALGTATVCLSLIVHTQWSKNELLTYPVARFLGETLQRDSTRRFPDILYNKIFWLGFLFVAVYHTYNGLATWFPAIPGFSGRINLGPLTVLFPNARQVVNMHGLFNPLIFFSVIAFAFFLDSRISLSLGVTNLIWVMFGAFLLANGMQLVGGPTGPGSGVLISFGAYLGIAVMIVYTGRRYYRDAALASFGLGAKQEIPAHVAWAGRGMLLATLVAVYGLYAAGMNVFWASLLTLVLLLMFLVMGRMVAETGLFFMKPLWVPASVITALFGFEMIGPTQFVLMALATALLAGDPRETLMPFILNGLKLGESATGDEPRGQGRLGVALLLMVFVSFFVAGAVTLHTQYNRGLSSADRFATQGVPAGPFRNLDRNVSELAARGTLSQVVAETTAGTPFRISPGSGVVPWVLGGFVVVLLFAFARLRFTRWPFHPVIFLVWGSFPIIRFGASFFIGWMIKEAVVKTTGAKGFRTVKPMMVGVIAAEVVAAIVWGTVSLIYYRNTGLPPINYNIFPR
jgi:hypothetical protein